MLSNHRQDLNFVRFQLWENFYFTLNYFDMGSLQLFTLKSTRLQFLLENLIDLQKKYHLHHWKHAIILQGYLNYSNSE